MLSQPPNRSRFMVEVAPFWATRSAAEDTSTRTEFVVAMSLRSAAASGTADFAPVKEEVRESRDSSRSGAEPARDLEPLPTDGMLSSTTTLANRSNEEHDGSEFG